MREGWGDRGGAYYNRLFQFTGGLGAFLFTQFTNSIHLIWISTLKRTIIRNLLNGGKA